MPDPLSVAKLDQLDQVQASGGDAAAISRLIEMLQESRDFHRLFDALLLQKRLEMGLPLTRPTSLDDVPEDRQQEFEEHYVAAARRIGEAFLADNNLSQAWLYFRTIREPQPVAQALDSLDVDRGAPENVEELIGIALYDGAHPVKGLELMLSARGTCNTITAFDQQLHQLRPLDRQQAAALLVRHLHADLCGSVGREIERKEGSLPSDRSLGGMILGRDWLFEDGNYHIDVSHLSSVVRFARFLEPASPELSPALELAEYGSRLSTQFQYPGEPPFDEYYPAHVRFFQVLANRERDEALAWFRKKLRDQPDDQDRRLVAYVLTDLLVRVGRLEEAVDVAAAHLADIDETAGFSLTRLCQQAGRFDVLRRVAREKGDLVTYTAALLNEGRTPAGA